MTERAERGTFEISDTDLLKGLQEKNLKLIDRYIQLLFFFFQNVSGFRTLYSNLITPRQGGRKAGSKHTQKFPFKQTPDKDRKNCIGRNGKQKRYRLSPMNCVFSHNQALWSPQNRSPVRFCFIICTNNYLITMQLYLCLRNTVFWHHLWNKAFYRNLPSTSHIQPVLNIIKAIQINLVFKNNLLNDSTSGGRWRVIWVTERIQHCTGRFSVLLTRTA